MSLDKTYDIKVGGKFNKHIKKNLTPKHKKLLDKKLKFFSENPHHNSLNTKKYGVSKKTLKRLQVDDVYEFYINMSLRCIFYVVHDIKIIILAFVGNHDECERKYS